MLRRSAKRDIHCQHYAHFKNPSGTLGSEFRQRQRKGGSSNQTVLADGLLDLSVGF